MSEPCKHLEKLIANPKAKDPLFESVYRYAGNRVDRVDNDYGVVKNYESEFIVKLQQLPLKPLQSDILIFRYVYDKSFKSIKELLKISSITTTIRLHNEALTLLRKVWRKR